jgi:hypothetical protein
VEELDLTERWVRKIEFPELKIGILALELSLMLNLEEKRAEHASELEIGPERLRLPSLEA